MNPEFETKPTARPTAESPDAKDPVTRAKERELAEIPPPPEKAGVDKPKGELESLDEDRRRVEKRTTL